MCIKTKTWEQLVFIHVNGQYDRRNKLEENKKGKEGVAAYRHDGSRRDEQNLFFSVYLQP